MATLHGGHFRLLSMVIGNDKSKKVIRMTIRNQLAILVGTIGWCITINPRRPSLRGLSAKLDTLLHDLSC